MLRIAAPIVSLTLLATAAGIGHADDEMSSQSVRVIAAPDADVEVDVAFDGKSKSWHFRWQRIRSARSAWAKSLPGVKQHAHLDVLVPRRGGRFVVVDSNAGHHHDARILVVSSGGKLLKKFGFADFMTAAEIEGLELSMSHTWWLAKKAYRWDKKGARVTLQTKAKKGRKSVAFVIDPAALTVTRR